MSAVKTIVDIINQCPEYIGKGIVQLLVITFGGVVVAWITTKIFGRLNYDGFSNDSKSY